MSEESHTFTFNPEVSRGLPLKKQSNSSLSADKSLWEILMRVSRDTCQFSAVNVALTYI